MIIPTKQTKHLLVINGLEESRSPESGSKEVNQGLLILPWEPFR